MMCFCSVDHCLQRPLIPPLVRIILCKTGGASSLHVLSLWDESRRHWSCWPEVIWNEVSRKHERNRSVTAAFSAPYFSFCSETWSLRWWGFFFPRNLFFFILLTSQDSLLLSRIFSPSHICMSCARNQKEERKLGLFFWGGEIFPFLIQNTQTGSPVEFIFS